MKTTPRGTGVKSTRTHIDEKHASGKHKSETGRKQRPVATVNSTAGSKRHHSDSPNTNSPSIVSKQQHTSSGRGQAKEQPIRVSEDPPPAPVEEEEEEEVINSLTVPMMEVPVEITPQEEEEISSSYSEDFEVREEEKEER